MDFKTTRVMNEFTRLEEASSPLVPVMLYMDSSFQRHTGAGMVVTGILRTPAEQLAICAKLIAAGRLKKAYRSVHEFWRGFDARTRHLDETTILKIADDVNLMFEYGGRHKVAFPHIGTAKHMHGQIPRLIYWAPGGGRT